MSRKIVFGEIEGIEEGHWFEGRKEMMETSFHRRWGSGIDGNGTEGVSAIVLSGGYEDDFDGGEEIIYTGAGGNDQNTGKQISDQSWDNPGNAGLRKSMDEGLPVRVVRGFKHKSPFSPISGYRYAGLYSVVDAWEEIGKSGFKICRFKLEYSGTNSGKRTAEEVELTNSILGKLPERKQGTVLRIVRDTKVAHEVKTFYNHECQICGNTISTKSGRYSEGAHIRPLGRPHNGTDDSSNLLCLCPNHHVMFDKGTISISDSFEILGDYVGLLIIKNGHNINKDNFQYHREIHGFN